MRNRHAFTLVEVLMVIGIIALLVTITAPMLGRAIFLARKAACATQISSALKGMALYATANGGRFPTCGYGRKTARFDEIGANITVDDPDPTDCDTNSNSRNLFLALRTKYVDPALMTCSAVKDAEGPNLVDSSNRLLYDFDVNVGGQYVAKCNYSFHLQFASREGGAKKGWPLVQTSHTEMAVLADKNPYVTYPGGAVNGGFRAKTIGVGADLNSPNHRYHGENEGQNVGYIDGHAEWKTAPHAGPSADNIYTVWNEDDVVDGMIAANSMPGGRTDCFLVP